MLLKSFSGRAFAAAFLIATAPSAVAIAQTTAAPLQAQVVTSTAAPLVAQPAPVVTAGSTLPANSDIWLALDSKLDSHDVMLGDKITFKVARDVMIGNYIVIPRGTPASGHISMRSGRGAFGKSAKLEFDIDTIDFANRSVPVSGHYRLNGDGNTGATLGAVALAGVVGGLFVKGKSAVAAQGSEWKASTKDAMPVRF